MASFKSTDDIIKHKYVDITEEKWLKEKRLKDCKWQLRNRRIEQSTSRNIIDKEDVYIQVQNE